jgi:hypothetical protein
MDVLEGDHGALHTVGSLLVEHDRVVDVQRILARRALEGHYPENPEEIIEWLEATGLEDGTVIRRRLSGAADERHGEIARARGGDMLWEEAELGVGAPSGEEDARP